MTVTKRAARSKGGMVRVPPITQAHAEKVLGRGLSAEAWGKICQAFADYGRRLDALEATKASRKKDDKKGWGAQQRAAVKAIEAAMSKIGKIKSDHAQFLHDASENYSLNTFGMSAMPRHDAKNLMDSAYKNLLYAVTIVERAEPLEIDTPTAATSRDILVREIYSAIGGTLSDGWRLDGLERPARVSDLTAFERLIVEMASASGAKLGAFAEVGDKRPLALAVWLRGAVHGGNRG